MSYLLEALHSLTVHHPRTMQRSNPKRGPRADPAYQSVARATGHEERPVETDATQNWPPNMCLSGSGVWLLSFRLCITHSGQPPSRIWFLFSLSRARGYVVLTPSPTYLKLRAPPQLRYVVIRYVRWLY